MSEVTHGPRDGIVRVNLDAWEDFYPFVHQLNDFTTYAYRGQRDAAWPLASSLDRLVGKTGSKVNARRHLKMFEAAVAGRRGVNPPQLKDGLLWALGQHNGLATPLLDWSRSPFVAAFFAFVEHNPKIARRAVWMVARSALEDLAERLKEVKRPAVIIYRPVMDENARLIYQARL